MTTTARPELAAVLDAAKTATNALIEGHDLEQSPSLNIHQKITEMTEIGMIQVLLRANHGNQSRTAQNMGINRATLRDRMHRYHLL
jgi:Fis family transcriptional regulator